MNRFASLRVGAVTALAALSVLSADLTAQRQRGPGSRSQDREALERRVRARFAQMIQERLGLDDGQSRALGEAMESFQEDRQRLAREDRALRTRMQALLVDPDPSPGEASALLEQMYALREEETRLFRGEQEALLEVLTPVQLVQFLAMREQFGERIRQLQGGQGRPGGPPGSPAGGGPGDLFDPW